MDISIVFDHLYISLIAWLGGIAIGGSIGYFFAQIFFNTTSKPDIDWKIILFPWRSLIFILILLVWSPLLVIWLGLGNLTGIVMVGITLSLLALSMTMSTLFHKRFPVSIKSTLLSNTRTLLIIAIFATLGVGYVGAGGFGFYFYQLVNLLNYNQLIKGFILLGVIAIFLDLILGFIQYLVVRASNPSPSE